MVLMFPTATSWIYGPANVDRKCLKEAVYLIERGGL